MDCLGSIDVEKMIKKYFERLCSYVGAKSTISKIPFAKSEKYTYTCQNIQHLRKRIICKNNEKELATLSFK